VETVLVVVGAVVVMLALAALVVARGRQATRMTDRARPRRPDSELHRQRAAAEAEVEDHDIDAMLDALNERRRRRQARDIGEELADELRRSTWDEPPPGA
jgi:hypothetical protein